MREGRERVLLTSASTPKGARKSAQLGAVWWAAEIKHARNRCPAPKENALRMGIPSANGGRSVDLTGSGEMGQTVEGVSYWRGKVSHLETAVHGVEQRGWPPQLRLISPQRPNRSGREWICGHARGTSGNVIEWACEGCVVSRSVSAEGLKA